MRILVVGASEAGSLMAHAINTVKMAQGFARLGHDVTMLCRQPVAGRLTDEQLNERYALTTTIRWHQIRSRVLLWRVEQGWLAGMLTALAARRVRAQFVYARSYLAPGMTSRRGIPTVAESHAHTDNRSRPFLELVRASKNREFRGWVTISQVLADHYAQLGVPREKLLVLPDAVDLTQFARPTTLPPSPYEGPGPHIVYAGHLYDYKGIPTVLEAAARLPQMQFHFVGGLPEDIARQQQRSRERGLTNAHFHGLKPQGDLPPYLWWSDALLLPPSLNHPSARWTSPVKLGEYLAAESPVVATDIPALRDWLTDDQVCFTPPDDADALAAAIQHTVGNPHLASQRVKRGREFAETISYKQRAQRVLDRFMPDGNGS